MSYQVTNRRSELNVKQDDLLASKRYLIEKKPETSHFYELEAAIVLDVILNDVHPEIIDKKLDPTDWPVDGNGEPAIDGQPNYSWVGMIKFRFIQSQIGDEKQILNWAYPMENTGVTEYPLMNEVVIVSRYMNQYFYSRKLNLKSNINTNASFELERTYGRVQQNTNEYTDKNYTGPVSSLNGEPENQEQNPNYSGVLGDYFKFNPAIRALKRYEGDSIIESRFGSSVRFGSYDENRKNDAGVGEYANNGGNPMIIIRNRQGKIKGSQEKTKIINKGYVTESINNDGSSIHITSGKTVSMFFPTVKKSIFSENIKEEQPAFSPVGSTDFKYPTQDGDQIIINSDRLIFSSKANETFHFSKKRYAIATDDEYTLDAQKQVVVTTNEMLSINSPLIFLGEAYQTTEPALLGNTSTLWMMTLCDWILNQSNWMIEMCDQWAKQHVHDKDSRGDVEMPPKPEWVLKMETHITALKDLMKELEALRDEAPKNKSQRVFLVGGGGAPGFAGGEVGGTGGKSEGVKLQAPEKDKPKESPEEIEQDYELVRVESSNV